MFEDEHHGPALTETPSELAFRVHWVALGLIAAVGCGGNAPIFAGAVATLSLIGTALLIANRESYAGTQWALFWRALLWMLPVWFVLTTLAVGHFFPPFHTVSLGENKAWALLPLPSVWVPVEGQIKVAGVETLLVAGVFATSLNAWLMCRSRLVFARTWAVLCLGAGALAALGLLQYFSNTDTILWIIPIGNPQFFASFPHPAQWCAFALLWLGAALGMIAWLVRQRGWRWLAGEGWLFLGAVLALGGSIAVVGEPAYRLLAALVAGLGCLSIAWQTREERRRTKRSGPGISLLAWALAGVALFGLAAQIAIHYPLDDWIQYSGGVAMHERVLEDTRNMWQARPWFGWGPGSFRVIYSFFQGAEPGRPILRLRPVGLLAKSRRARDYRHRHLVVACGVAPRAGPLASPARVVSHRARRRPRRHRRAHPRGFPARLARRVFRLLAAPVLRRPLVGSGPGRQEFGPHRSPAHQTTPRHRAIPHAPLPISPRTHPADDARGQIVSLRRNLKTAVASTLNVERFKHLPELRKSSPK